MSDAIVPEMNPSEVTAYPELLFTYGAMTENRVHYGRICEFITEKKSALLQGSVYRLESGYPVYSNEGGDLIPGDLVRLSGGPTFWKILDELSGFTAQNPDRSLFHRLAVAANVGGEAISCQVYAVNVSRLPRSVQKITGGDWQRDLQEREPMVQLLTPNQRNYIQKLGRSTGRDIVPINLDLYRELMNKGLIVDKGRRLALTNLGQEVFRYLG